MSISYVLVLLGLGVFGLAVWAMFWAIDDGQYDDLEAQGRSILEEEEIDALLEPEEEPEVEARPATKPGMGPAENGA